VDTVRAMETLRQERQRKRQEGDAAMM